MKRFVGLLVLVSLAYGGSERGSGRKGGDSVYCRPTPASGFAGYYSLDYALALNWGTDIVDVRSWQESSARILKVLGRLSPYLQESFKSFLAFQQGGLLSPRSWEQATHGLVDIEDEQLLRRVPPNCVDRTSGRPQLIQAIIRIDRPSQIQYLYDPKILGELGKNPLQYSFLMVHEWLWDHVDDVEALRKVNYILHSRQGETMEPDEFYRFLKQAGFGPSLEFVPVCTRSESMRRALESITGLTCDAIKQIPGDRSYPVNLQNKGLNNLRDGDFSGLGKFYVLQLQRNEFRTLPEFIFSGHSEIWQLHLGENRNLESLPERLFSGLEIHQLDFQNSPRLTRLPPRLFSLARSLKTIHLKNHPNLVLSPGLFVGVPGLEFLALEKIGPITVKRLEGVLDENASFAINVSRADVDEATWKYGLLNRRFPKIKFGYR
jgi:hypothetical protein